MAPKYVIHLIFCVVFTTVGIVLLGASSKDLAERRERIEQMTPAEKAELARKEERFARLSPEKQELLRKLHKALEDDPNGEELREIMQSYCDWLAMLPSSKNRAELKKMPIERRIKFIKNRWISNHDDEIIREWSKAYFAKHGLPPQKFRENFAKRATSPRQFNARQKKALQKYAKLMRFPEADLKELFDQLSPAVRNQQKKKTLEKQRLWVAGRIHHITARSYFMRGMSSVVSDEKLAQFFATLPEELREDLLRSPGDEMHNRLLQMYRWSQGPRRPPRGERGPGRSHRGGGMAPPGEGTGPRGRGKRPWEGGPDAPPPGPPEDH